MRAALRQAQGAYAIAVHAQAASRAASSARAMNVPLIVGLGDGENFLASDVAAVLAHTRRVIFLEEGDVADLPADGVVDHRRRRLAARAARHRGRLVDRGRREGRLRALHAQGDARAAARRSATAIAGRLHGDEIALDELEPVVDAILRAIERVELVACGSANYASAVRRVPAPGLGRPAGPLEHRLRVPLQPAAAGRAHAGHRGDPVGRDGRHASRRCGSRASAAAPLIAITNTVGSAITREADAVLFLQAGPEIAVVATKTFVTQVDHARAPGGGPGQGPRPARRRTPRRRAGGARCASCPTRPQRALELAAPARELARRYVNSRGFMFVGRGVTYPVALEGALKLKEVSYVHAEGYAAGELKHGPISLLDAEVPLVAVATRSARPGEADQQRHGGPRPRRPRGGRGDRGRRADARASPTTSCGCPTPSRRSAPVLAIIPLQLFAYHMAVVRGTDVDQPRNLAKSVTVE